MFLAARPRNRLTDASPPHKNGDADAMDPALQRRRATDDMLLADPTQDAVPLQRSEADVPMLSAAQVRQELLSIRGLLAV